MDFEGTACHAYRDDSPFYASARLRVSRSAGATSYKFPVKIVCSNAYASGGAVSEVDVRIPRGLLT